jgi:hypothetical protein
VGPVGTTVKELINNQSVRIKKPVGWDEVLNGKLTPIQFTPNEATNKISFKLPLMLRTIGAKRESKKAKLIPLSLFPGGITIQIKLNPRAFYVDFSLDASKTMEDAIHYREVSREIATGGNTDFARRYSLSNLHLKTVQFRYDDDSIKSVLDQTLLGFNYFLTEDKKLLKSDFWEEYNPQKVFYNNVDQNDVVKNRVLTTV